VSPDNGPLWLQLAELLEELGRATEARSAAEEAAKHLEEGEDRDAARELIERLDTAPPEAARNLVNQLLAELDPARLTADGRVQGETPAPLVLDRERKTFADVGGLDEVKDTIRLKIVLPFQKPDVFKAYGKRQGGGILLYGPPGCGKTLLARATAGECDAVFLNVKIDDVLDMWLGESEKKLAALFTDARKKAPAVLFFDELEAIGGSRQIKHNAARTLVNQLLAELDGMASANQRLLVMAATNAPWHVDSALRRPGRFDRVVFVPPPDKTARVEVLRLHLKDRPVDPKVDVAGLAARTADFSGADLHELVERAVEAPLKEALRTGTVRPLTQADLDAALKAQQPTTREWFATAKNYATFANTGGLYDDLLAYLKARG
jgi:transitional endoplasmic reticulum ATPase